MKRLIHGFFLLISYIALFPIVRWMSVILVSTFKRVETILQSEQLLHISLYYLKNQVPSSITKLLVVEGFI